MINQKRNELAESLEAEVLERFLKYVAIDTQSQDESETFPSTKKQFDLLNFLVEELKSLGVEDVLLDQYGYVMAKIPASEGYESAPAVGLIAHVDTSPDLSGANVCPCIHRNYDGSELPLGSDYRLSPKQFPEMLELLGHTLITTDGTTLLGADDKAGIAEIMTAVSYLMKNPNVKHGVICVGFTPDEEVGRGVDYFDVKKFGAKYAYTVDGGIEGELEYENFNAASAQIRAKGLNVHPGYAKDKMVNALSLLTELDCSLPREQRPECTEGYEGFFHLIDLAGSVDEAKSVYIIRDHDRSKFEAMKELLAKRVDEINARYTQTVLELELEDQYYNMKEQVLPHPQMICLAEQAMEQAEVKALIRPIRGGTDGARLSYMGLPCPNLFTGGANFHGRYEYVSLTTMSKAVETLIHLVELWSNDSF